MHGSKRKGAAAFAVLTIAALAIVASAFARADVAPTAASASTAGCDSPTIGFMGPITGDAAFIGKEQLGFAQYAIKRLAKGKIKLTQGDTQLDPAQASTVGAKFQADSNMLAVVGPAGSQEVLAVAPIFKKSQRMPFISGSATKTSLTAGGIPNFFRTVPNDSVQSPTTAKFIRQVLKAKSVFIVDDQTAYSKPLANGVQANLKAGGVKVTRNSVNQKVTDFSSLVSKIGDDVTVVFLPWQIAANGQIFGEQMKEQGKKANIFGSDGMDSGDFNIDGRLRLGVRAGHPRHRRATRPHHAATARSSSRTSARRPTWRRSRDRGDPEGVRRRQRDARRGAEEPARDRLAEDRAG